MKCLVVVLVASIYSAYELGITGVIALRVGMRSKEMYRAPLGSLHTGTTLVYTHAHVDTTVL